MKKFRILKITVAVAVLAICINYFFIDAFEIPLELFFIILAVMFLLDGIEELKAEKGDRPMGFIYLGASLLFFILLAGQQFNFY